MERQLRRGFCALMVSVCWVADAPAQTRLAGWEGLVRMVMASAATDAVDAELLRATAAELAVGSSTFLQMLEALKAAPHMHLRARPVRRRSLGRGHFAVAGTFTTGLMEISVFRRDPHLQVRAVAHEVAHATEIACLPRQADTGALHQRLMDRAGREGSIKGHGIETPFARAAERIVLREYLGHGTNVGQLAYLTVTYELPLCRDLFSPAAPLHAEFSQPVR